MKSSTETGGHSALADAVAIIGMSGRFPGASTIQEYWDLLRGGREAVKFFTEEELIQNGFDRELIRKPNYIPAKPVLEGIEDFDAAFFRISPREAELMDPQHRVFLECAWAAMEDAAHDPWRHPGRIGVFAACGKNTYLLFHLLPHADWIQSEEVFQLLLGNEKDYLSSRISYKLNLTGPSITVQSACSSSLVALHMACQSLLLGECDMALAGGVSVDTPVAGYLYRPGGVLSPDGHSRAFDAEARGCTFGHGAGVVILRKAADALADGDQIYAVIRGTAINNDGADRAGFTAPSARGQAQAIQEALEVSGVLPETISYVEAHGTATPIGDPIELEALTQAYGAYTERKQYCALGSVKTNIGHLSAAAGVAGLIKTVLALRYRQLPPSLHFRTPNPQICFEETPFFVNTELKEWVSEGPRRAAVSSFGQGGTNAHVILEEAPVRESTASSRAEHVLLLSAQTSAALEEASSLLARTLRAVSFELADVAYTLQAGRRRFAHRRFVVCQSKESAVEALSALDRARVFDGRVTGAPGSVCFLFPEVAPDEYCFPSHVYQNEPVFQRALEECSRLAPGLTEAIAKAAAGVAATKLRESEYRVLVVATQYAMARLWQARGIRSGSAAGEGTGVLVAESINRGRTLAEMLVEARTGNGIGKHASVMEAANASVRLVIAPRHNLRAAEAGKEIDCGNDLARAAGHLWLRGVECDWKAWYSGEKRLRVSLPPYPFQRQRHWIEPTYTVQPVYSTVPAAPRLTLPPDATAEEAQAALASVFANVLGVPHVGPHDDFFDLGGHSLLEVQVRGRVEELLGAKLPQGVLFDRPTVAGLAELVLESRKGSPPARSTRAELARDIVLDDNVCAANLEFRFPNESDDVFLTGATGFLGIHILNRLLSSVRSRVHCLVRARTPEEGYDKLRDAAALYRIELPELDRRVIPVPGDLAAPRLGLTGGTFEHLAESVASVYHCGAAVNFVQSYRLLKPANVDGVREVLRFAAAGRLKSVHHVSSVAVFESETYEQVLFATEDEDLSRSTGFHNGYDTTKWVAEQIISLARARGVPVSIYRLSNIAGHSQTGVMLPQHIIAAFLKGCVQLGAAPAGDNIVNLLPVDTASRMLVELSLQPGALGGTYHVVSPEATWVRDIMQWLIARGYGLQGRSYEEWREELRQAPEDNVLKVFLPLLDEAPLFTNRRYDMANVGSRLQNLDRDYAFFNELLLERYLSYMFSSGYLRPAQGRVCASTACAPART